MYQSRSERLKAKRMQNKRRLLWIAALVTLLLTAVFAIAGYLFLSPAPNPEGKEQAKSPDQQATGPEKDGQPVVNLSFVGDVMMDGHVERLLQEKGFDFPYAHVSKLFQQDDYTIANLETPVTHRGAPEANKQYVYKSPPEALPAMKTAGVDLVNLANNHSMDQGAQGLLDTFQALDQNGIAYVGAGADANRAYEPVLVEHKGIRIAFLGFSRVVPEVSWYAGKNKPGLAVSYDPTRAVEAIRAANQRADLVIVIAHWGKEKVDFPVDHQKDLARAYIDAGADLIIGGHPHVLQGFESYKNKWIAYSLGNFIFTRASDPKTWETMVLQATCTKTGSCELKMLPHHAELGQAVPMNEQDANTLIQRIQSISTNVRIQPDGRVEEKP